MPLLRTLLFVPGNKYRMMEKAAGLGADAVVLDLEDAVAPADKDSARQQIREALGAIDFGRSQVFARINAVCTPHLNADLESVIHPKLTGLCVPKTETAAELQGLDRQVAALEGQRGVAAGATHFVAFLETARGILNVQEISTVTPRMLALTLGAEDFTLDMGIARTEEAKELFVPRCQIALAAAAARIMAIDTVYTDLGNEEGLLRETRLIKSLGFHGKLAIHPKQVQTIHQAFAPSEEEIAYARRVLEAFESAQGTGVIAVDGKMVDEPVVGKARAILQLAGTS